ncbi:MAG: hypothetical protein ABW088_15825 [Sedimenticola sp.]
MKHSRMATAAAGLILTVTSTLSFAEQNGGDLFKYYACNSCHGENGSAPIKDEIPSLNGIGEEKLVQLMKDYIEKKAHSNEGDCDTPPTNPHLNKIASWLSKQ